MLCAQMKAIEPVCPATNDYNVVKPGLECDNEPSESAEVRSRGDLTFSQTEAQELASESRLLAFLLAQCGWKLRA